MDTHKQYCRYSVYNWGTTNGETQAVLRTVLTTGVAIGLQLGHPEIVTHDSNAEACHHSDGFAHLTAWHHCRYIFPGLAMGAHLGQTGVITDMMMTAAAEALPKLIPQQDLDKGVVYPRLSNIRCVLLPMHAYMAR